MENLERIWTYNCWTHLCLNYQAIILNGDISWSCSCRTVNLKICESFGRSQTRGKRKTSFIWRREAAFMLKRRDRTWRTRGFSMGEVGDNAEMHGNGHMNGESRQNRWEGDNELCETTEKVYYGQFVGCLGDTVGERWRRRVGDYIWLEFLRSRYVLRSTSLSWMIRTRRGASWGREKDMRGQCNRLLHCGVWSREFFEEQLCFYICACDMENGCGLGKSFCF